MYIYKISQDINGGYDTYDSAVVVAISAIDAADIHPDDIEWNGLGSVGAWVTRKNINKIKVELIGDAHPEQKRGVILASFNAG